MDGPDFLVREILWGSPEYRQTLLLRDQVLRKPLGLSLFSEDLSAERDALHLAAFLGETLAGVLLLFKGEEGFLRMRQVAVWEDFRRQGAGRSLVLRAEELARVEGAAGIRLHARKEAAGFYLRLSYQVTGEEFLEVTIPHLPMEKRF